MSVQQPLQTDKERFNKMPVKYRTRVSIDTANVEVLMPVWHDPDDSDYARIRYTDETKSGSTQTIEKPIHRFVAMAEYGIDTVRQPDTVVHHENQVKSINSRENLTPLDKHTHTQIHNHGSLSREFRYDPCRGEYTDITFEDSDYWVNPDAPEPERYENTTQGLRKFCIDYINYGPISIKHLSDRWGNSVTEEDIAGHVSLAMHDHDTHIQHLFNNVYGPCELSLSQLHPYEKPTPISSSNTDGNHISVSKYALLHLRDNQIVSPTQLTRELPHHDKNHIRTALDMFACTGTIEYHPHTDTYTDPDADISRWSRAYNCLSQHIPFL